MALIDELTRRLNEVNAEISYLENWLNSIYPSDKNLLRGEFLTTWNNLPGSLTVQIAAATGKYDMLVSLIEAGDSSGVADLMNGLAGSLNVAPALNNIVFGIFNNFIPKISDSVSQRNEKFSALLLYRKEAASITAQITGTTILGVAQTQADAAATQADTALAKVAYGKILVWWAKYKWYIIALVAGIALFFAGKFLFKKYGK